MRLQTRDTRLRVHSVTRASQGGRRALAVPLVEGVEVGLDLEHLACGQVLFWGLRVGARDQGLGVRVQGLDLEHQIVPLEAKP